MTAAIQKRWLIILCKKLYPPKSDGLLKSNQVLANEVVNASQLAVPAASTAVIV
jgi:hypothetical protein